MSAHWADQLFRLFTGEPQARNFARFASVFPVRVVRRSALSAPLAVANALPLPPRYVFNADKRDTAAFLAETETAGLLVATPNGVVHESYAFGLDAATQWPLWSITKSLVSVLVGAVGVDIHQPVTQFVPEFAGTGYDGVSIEHVLQMRSGVRWNENYADPQSDIRRSQLARLAGGSQDRFARSLPREHAPGTVFRYNTTDTQVLGSVLRAITGRSLSALLQRHLWEPLGMQDDAFWVLDGEGAEWAGSGLVATLRDVARIGLLLMSAGRWKGQPLLPSAWVKSSTRAAADALQPGQMNPGSALGYGHHWWVTPRGFCAIGIYNQFLYVDTVAQVVIAKFSANRHYASSPVFGETGYRHEEHLALFEAIAEACGGRLIV